MITNKINKFFEYFIRTLNNIMNAELLDSSRIAKSILLFSMIDTLSNCFYKGEYNHDKFVKYIDNYSGWSYKDKVSLIQLHYYLQDKTESKYSGIKEYISEKMNKLSQGADIRSNFDMYISELQFSKEIRKEIIKFSYSELLYKYRNHVVHEFRIPGHGLDFEEDDDVYYHSLERDTNEISNHITYELVFPLNYLKLLVNDLIIHSEDNCLKNSINPYEKFNYSKLWWK